ncbi:MAG: endopeptidase La [Clostridia bacterium]|nr:endopeptidase La [Clostridia bacterium]
MENEIKDIVKAPVLPLRGLVIFPGSILHFDISRNKSMRALGAAMKNDQQLVFITAQKDPFNEEPKKDDLFSVGVIARVLQMVRLSENIVRVVVKGMYRAEMVSAKEKSGYILADIKECEITHPSSEAKKDAMINVAKEIFDDYLMFNSRITNDIVMTVHEMKDEGDLADYIADNMIRDYEKKQEILEALDEDERMEKVIAMFRYETDILAIEEELTEKTKNGLDNNQKEYYLREKLKAIREELGETDDITEEVFEYQEKIENLRTTDENKSILLKEVSRLEKMFGNSAEANVVRNYLDACIELPWGIYTKEKNDIKRIAKVLDKNHYGLKKVKENVIEALAVRKLNPSINGQIICLAGPPGVGKTSIAHSIADATGRNYERIALGGVHDEAEIRGHRRTYIGAMMGRIMNAIKLAGSANPLILLDEVDKLGSDFRGDPTSALLEVLDGEQNSTFYDHYIDMPFDLSKVMFITTANDYTAIPAPLLDRMDIIHIDSYTREEKFNIAKKHLISKQLKRHGFSTRNFKISDEAIYDIIDSYTRESGVRSLERDISKLMNKAAVKIVSGEQYSVKISTDNIEEYLGSRKYKNDTMNKSDEVGVATGLAWTAVGGETLPVEVAVMKGTGKIELTGSLGDVMKESAHAAYTCVRTMAEKLSIDSDFYKDKDIHIHVPEGAVPKDGPSAGITLATAITSALTGIPVRKDVAMTGEITIRGRVLPIGGLKEKTMAAYRLGIKTVIIPKDNKADLDEVDDVVKNAINFVMADNIDTVLDTALVKE